MKRAISSNELFHFTKFENLLGIIENGFYPRICLEYTFQSDLFPARPSMICPIPMVSFCDIPLYLVEEHSDKYGKTAIGLSKEWGMNYGLNPVVYLHPNSRLGDAQSALSNSFSGYHSSQVPNLKVVMMITQALTSTIHIGCFLKQYERTNDEEILINGRKYLFPKGRFYDEREWRFVALNQDRAFIPIDASDIKDVEKMNVHHEKLKTQKLNFKLTDIKNIIYETDDQKDQIIFALQKRFKCSTENIAQNIIITQIKDCFNIF